MGLVSLLVNVTLLQVPDEPAATRTERATALLEAAAAGGADIAVLPADYASSEAQARAEFGALAGKLGMAICATYTDSDTSSLALYSYNGSLALQYSAPKGSIAAPRAGKHPSSVQLELKPSCPQCPPRVAKVGAMLGTDFMFYQPARVLMVQGAEIVLNPVAVPALHAAAFDTENTNHTHEGKFMSALVQDNYMHFATANYATINGSDGGGSGGGRGGMTFAEPSERVIVQVVNVSQIRADRLVAGVWGAGTDFLSRKPFQYQPLCYEKARDEHAVANCNARRPREEAEAENNDGPVVKVAMLQMNAVGVAFDKDPVPAHLERATMFIREAKRRGADIVVFPEQWSVGFSRNFNKDQYPDADSWSTVYGSYVSTRPACLLT
jgi:predicted amidohydrolase